MPTCKGCLSRFPNRTKINGKDQDLSRRKYCLSCHPFGWRKRNAKNTASDSRGQKCTCQKCGRKYIYLRKKGGTLKECNSCTVNKRRFGIKKKSIEYKGGSCLRCRYNACDEALVFHHINGDEKKFSISGAHCRSWKTIQEELDKCILLCNRCHSELHAGLWSL